MESSNGQSSSRDDRSSSAATSGSKRKKMTLPDRISTTTAENPIMAALGATPRGSMNNVKSWAKRPSAASNESLFQTFSAPAALNIPAPPTETVDQVKRMEVIEPSERAVEHRATQLRREIHISSPAGQEDEEWEEPVVVATASPPREEPARVLGGFDCQPLDLILYVFSFLVASEDIFTMAQVSYRWRELTNSLALCRTLRNTTAEGGVNWLNFQNMGVKNKGTEGTCFKCRQRSTAKFLAMKRARVFPKGEGVPYYMLRELAVLKGMDHPHLARLQLVSLAKDELHVFFPYVDRTLHEIINPTSDPGGGKILPQPIIRRLLHQLLDAIAYCHRRGVLHRNLKPKHLLVSTDDATPENLENAVLQVSDFALVRATGLPRRTYTMEVVTLWYRPPEILMGVRGYTQAVDIWSIGCIFAEMLQGKPLFTGISEIDQLFQIFSKLSTPTSETWPQFKVLPNFGFDFPNWKHDSCPLSRLFPALDPLGVDLLSKLLMYDPDQRITAEAALRHPYFAEINGNFAVPRLIPKLELKPQHISENPSLEQMLLFHDYLRDAEQQLWTNINYLNRQRTLRPIHRAMLVDWLIEVVDVFEMCLRTAFLAVNYTDRYLDTVLVKKNKFQLLGATCLHVASKCEDVSYIGVEDLAMCADNVYTSTEVLQTEEKLLNALNFTLSVPTVLDFLNVFKYSMPELPKKTQYLAQYLAELSLQEYDFLKYKPSLIAACCLSLAHFCLEEISWSPEMQSVTRYEWKDLKGCMSDLQGVYSNSPFSVLAVIKKRYMKSDRCQVSALSPPTRYNMTFD